MSVDELLNASAGNRKVYDLIDLLDANQSDRGNETIEQALARMFGPVTDEMIFALTIMCRDTAEQMAAQAVKKGATGEEATAGALMRLFVVAIDLGQQLGFGAAARWPLADTP